MAFHPARFIPLAFALGLAALSPAQAQMTPELVAARAALSAAAFHFSGHPCYFQVDNLITTIEPFGHSFAQGPLQTTVATALQSGLERAARSVPAPFKILKAKHLPTEEREILANAQGQLFVRVRVYTVKGRRSTSTERAAWDNNTWSL
ncbi:hypothetical protein MF271_22540 (plasmid) [Deinococcus sp. KNUC1210]|uniref:hypothetical protein n=1 Tax=Deinococcus sp. KNUC1210 TaxID=2917691 RepID=UPI001EF0AD8A|nr:hypothetical protein [Deinococcus sp. KNUC1210]ULH18247.1 hypothetical protein MF271_22540 [Deinococcus sp. KNUC1210]